MKRGVRDAGKAVAKIGRASLEGAASLTAQGLHEGSKLAADAFVKLKNYKPPEAVFGAAPSLAMMKEINGRKTMFRGAWFWYYYRVYYPYVFPPLFLLFMIIALSGWNSIEGHIVLGSILSLISSVSVVISYIMIQPWQKHPSKLVLYRALTSVVFSLNLLFEAIGTNSTSCRSYATVTEYTLLAGECWLTTIALDLVYSLTNPFSSYKENMRRYQIMVWGFTGLLSLIFYSDTNCQGVFDKGICWIKIQGTSSPCLWGYYLFWILIMYLYQASATIFAYFRLNQGLPATFEVRKKCAQETFKCLLVYAIYLTLLFFMFAIIAGQHADTNPQPGSSMGNFALFFLFIISNRGSVDGIVWFMLHDFARDDPPSNSSPASPRGKKQKFKSVVQDEEEGGDEDGEDEAVESSEVDGRMRTISVGDDMRHKIKDLAKDASKTFQELADLAITEIDEADLSPQVNMALRQQIVTYVSRGVKDSIEREGLRRPQDYDLKYYLDNFFIDVFVNWETKDPAVTPGLEVFEFVMDEHPFKTFAPTVFKQLREGEGITDEEYLRVLSSNAKERLSEGASGAFMIFCGGGEFIVKTIRAREARVLHESLPAYAAYLKENKDSFLCRFLGSYSLKMYAQTFYFVVMRNCFDPTAEINERFDIKGSWVGRSAEKEKGTKRTVCRHCNTYFIPSKKEKCDVIVGPHESNQVLKDNDLRTKISLNPAEYARVMNMLKKDSDLLGKLGVMDYSLLLGIKKRKFDVSEQMEAGSGSVHASSRGNNSTFYASSVTGPAVYHLGIVDFLQDWSRKKKIERAMKIYMARKDPDGLSVMHPKHYKDRFQTCMDQIFESTAGLSSRNTSTQNLQAAATTSATVASIHRVVAAGGGGGAGAGEGVALGEEVMNPLIKSTPKKGKKAKPTSSESSVDAQVLSIAAEMERIYAAHNPSKIAEIPSLLEKYRGRELEVVEGLRQKYPAEPAVVVAPVVETPASGSALALPLELAVNTTSQMDESIDEFAEYLDSTAVMEETSKEPDDSGMDML